MHIPCGNKFYRLHCASMHSHPVVATPRNSTSMQSRSDPEKLRSSAPMQSYPVPTKLRFTTSTQSTPVAGDAYRHILSLAISVIETPAFFPFPGEGNEGELLTYLTF